MTPAKPFDTYKWRWLSVTPSEGLLQAPVFLGVLRALASHEGEAFTSANLQQELGKVQVATRSTVTLGRDMDRNLFRNSGQYWRGTGLLTPNSGVIHLTNLGRQVAAGRITQGEFAALMIQQTVLPNPATYSAVEIAKWHDSGLQLRPLAIILEVMEEIGRHSLISSLNNEELTRVVIPLSGVGVDPRAIAEYVIEYRKGRLNVSDWPDCAPDANDKRLAREFLLFLANFGLLRLGARERFRDEQNFYLDENFDVTAVVPKEEASIFNGEQSAEDALKQIRHSPLPSIIERQRTITRVLSRTGQSRFRSRIMKAYEGRCFLTGEAVPEVLEAAHIVPVTNSGADHENNGFCMRVDIHRLYDSGHLRIRADGSLMLSDAAAQSPSYKVLPARVRLPAFVNPANVSWRDSYS